MLDQLLGLIAQSSVAEALKASQFVYPLVNALHILALATLFGSIAVLDLCILARARADFLAPLAHIVPPIAGSGLVVAAASGLLLFSVQPFDYAANPAFRLKLVLVLAGAIHAAVLHATPDFRRLLATGRSSVALAVSAAFSLLVWMAAIFAGRFIAFLA